MAVLISSLTIGDLCTIFTPEKRYCDTIIFNVYMKLGESIRIQIQALMYRATFLNFLMNNKIICFPDHINRLNCNLCAFLKTVAVFSGLYDYSDTLVLVN